jgi:hypothetical protein
MLICLSSPRKKVTIHNLSIKDRREGALKRELHNLRDSGCSEPGIDAENWPDCTRKVPSFPAASGKGGNHCGYVGEHTSKISSDLMIPVKSSVFFFNGFPEKSSSGAKI